MKLTQSVTSLHDFQQPARLTLSEVQKHRTKEDAWMVLRGKVCLLVHSQPSSAIRMAHAQVYNITPYLDYHPGGVDELMRGAGIDATVLFEEIHPWVAVDHMLSKAFLGNLELEDSSEVVTREGSAGPPPGRSPLSSTQWTPCTLLWRAPACESGVFQRYRFKLPPDIALVSTLLARLLNPTSVFLSRARLWFACSAGQQPSNTLTFVNCWDQVVLFSVRTPLFPAWPWCAPKRRLLNL